MCVYDVASLGPSRVDSTRHRISFDSRNDGPKCVPEVSCVAGNICQAQPMAPATLTACSANATVPKGLADRCCSPRHKTRRTSRNEGSKRVG